LDSRQSRSFGGSPFGGPVKPKLLVPPGLLYEACRPCKYRGKPAASAWRRLRQPPSP
jgi:hypothetical protein